MRKELEKSPGRLFNRGEERSTVTLTCLDAERFGLRIMESMFHGGGAAV